MFVKKKKVESKSILNQSHKSKRMDFACENLIESTNWRQVIFSDEKRWNLDGQDGNESFYWLMKDGQPEKYYRYRRYQGGKSTMYWGCFSYYVVGQLIKCPATVTTNRYQQILQQHLLPWLHQNNFNNCIFQQDNAPPHSAKSTMQWIKDNNILILEWPPCSPDCNPIENLWSIVSQTVYKNGRQYSSIQELESSIGTASRSISIETCQRLINSMNNRLVQVIEVSGSHINY